MKHAFPLVMWMLCASAALAEPPPSSPSRATASQLVEQQLLVPLQRAEAKRRRFSRAAPVALERRVRVLDESEQTDARGKAFVRFAIDERRPFDGPDTWRSSSIVGCAYPGERQVFVQRGQAHVAARSLLGDEAPARRDVCRTSEQAAAAVTKQAPADTMHAKATVPHSKR